jgi:hypothetical protein
LNGKGARLKNLSGHTSNTFVNFNKEMEKKHEKDVLQNDDRVYVGRAAQAVAQSTDNMKQDQSQQDQMKHDMDEATEEQSVSKRPMFGTTFPS